MTVMSSWDLFEDLRDTQEELLRMNRMRGYKVDQQHVGAAATVWIPPVDISERKDAYLVSVELPGIGIDDLEITFESGLLTIQGERHVAHDSAEQKMHRVERRYGAFRRSITLPTHVMADAIEASMQDGVLQIMVPKAAEVQPKRIAVRAAPGNTALDAGKDGTTRS
jgi:HSP20 family protein